jgi:hypothetical protein
VWGIHEAVMQYKTNKNSANLKWRMPTLGSPGVDPTAQASPATYRYIIYCITTVVFWNLQYFHPLSRRPY